MTKLIGVLFIVAAICASATAQQESKASSDAVPAGTQTDRLPPIEPRFKSVIESPPAISRIEGQRRIWFPPPGFVITETKWVVKDGAVFFEISSGMLLPVPGGGASGCFDSNLKERMAKLRPIIEAFPSPRR